MANVTRDSLKKRLFSDPQNYPYGFSRSGDYDEFRVTFRYFSYSIRFDSSYYFCKLTLGRRSFSSISLYLFLFSICCTLASRASLSS